MIATCRRNISQNCWAQHVVCVLPPCCDKLQHVGCCWLKFDHFQTSANNTRNFATVIRWPNDRNNVALCRVGMLRSSRRGLSFELLTTKTNAAVKSWLLHWGIDSSFSFPCDLFVWHWNETYITSLKLSVLENIQQVTETRIEIFLPYERFKQRFPLMLILCISPNHHSQKYWHIDIA